MSNDNKRTPINALAIPMFERFVLEGRDEDFIAILDQDDMLIGTAGRLPKDRGKVSRQWHVTGFSKHGTFVFNFEQIEQIVNEWLDENFVR